MGKEEKTEEIVKQLVNFLPTCIGIILSLLIQNLLHNSHRPTPDKHNFILAGNLHF